MRPADWGSVPTGVPPVRLFGKFYLCTSFNLYTPVSDGVKGTDDPWMASNRPPERGLATGRAWRAC